ncbi:major facilitator superfamily domain-containing protein [Apiospora kogelbergensis]|uniref:major facilitator superfamily domain-containing protein n=1 Tax=Apiospora kogelbergensis TaxID=1337665 RepID=UPI003130C50B
MANTLFVAGEVLLQKIPEQQISSPSQEPAAPHEEGRRLHFWGTFVALCTLAFISALDVSIISTSLPAIIASIGGATEFVWVANSFVIASTVPQPLFCQVADISGRRAPLFFSFALFALGNGIVGGAHNVTMLIAGRTVQGVGAGCIYILIDIVLLGPRPAQLALDLLNQPPICGLVLFLLLAFMQVKMTPLQGQNWMGAVLWGLIFGGNRYPWSSFRIAVPLVLGILGWISFYIQQRFTRHQSVLTRLFTNWASAIAFFLTISSSILTQSLALDH